MFIWNIPQLFLFKQIFSLMVLYYFIILFLSVIFHYFFPFTSLNICTWTWYKLYFVMPCRLVFLLYSANFLNKLSCAINVFRILNCLFVISIINQEGIHILWLLCGFIDTTDTIKGEPHQKPCAVIIIYYSIFKNSFALNWITYNSPSLLSLRTLKLTSAPQISTVFGN